VKTAVKAENNKTIAAKAVPKLSQEHKDLKV